MAKKTNMENSKERKRTSGLLRDKERTKARMVAAVGKVLQKKGYSGLSASNIANAAGVDKRLVWTYFKGVDNLIKEYLLQKEFWKDDEDTLEYQSLAERVQSEPFTIGKDETVNMILQQFQAFNKDRQMQSIMLWELASKSKILRQVADKREATSEMLLSILDPIFKNSKIDIRATLSLLLGGIFFLNLQSRGIGGPCCGIDLGTSEGKERISETLKAIISMVFENTKDSQSVSTSI